jgi:hypothetical protein
MAEQSSGRKAEQPRPAREVILGDGAATLTFMVINSVWDEVRACVATLSSCSRTDDRVQRGWKGKR